MKARKMWTTDNEMTRCRQGAGVILWPDYTGGSHHPVLVIDAEGMPDFEPGDRVKHHALRPVILEVMSHPTPVNGAWWVVVREKGGVPQAALCDNLTKLPREKTVMLKVTGPEEAVETEVCHIGVGPHASGVRVERVDP